MYVSLRTALIWSAFAAITAAQAHVTLDTSQAPALGYVRIAARVPHGCEGEATIGLRVQIPDGVTAVKPQPKPGWTLQVVTEPAAGTASGHDSSPPVREVLWRAQPGQALSDDFFDEFVLRVRMPDAAGQTIWFPFVQECAGTRSAVGLSALVRARPTSSSANPRIPFVSCRSPS